MPRSNKHLKIFAISLCLTVQALCDPCKQSLSNFGNLIMSEELFIESVSEVRSIENGDGHTVTVIGEETNRLINVIRDECKNMPMAQIQDAAKEAFGKIDKSVKRKCLRVFMPFFIDLFNPEVHKYDEYRTESQNFLGKILIDKYLEDFANHAKKAIGAAAHVADVGGHAALKIGGPAAVAALKIGGPVAMAAIQTALHAPLIYSTINSTLGGSLDVIIIMGATTGTGVVGAAIGSCFAGVGEVVGGPVGAIAAGSLAKLAVGFLHSQDNLKITPKKYTKLSPS